MRSPEQHVGAVRRLLADLTLEAEHVPVAESAGRVLAVDVTAAFNSPRFDNSQMDGYALSVNHVTATPGQFRVGRTIPAGTDPDEVYPDGINSAIVPIMTGSKVPRGTTSVVAVEDTTPGTFAEEGEFIHVPAVEHGQYIRRAGADLAAGDVLLEAGAEITAAGVAALAGQAIETVPVTRRARIIVSTGGAEIGGTGAASIPDSNTPMLRALAGRYGIEVVAHVPTDDDPVKLRESLTASVEKHAPDAIVTSGGISAGKFEVVRQILEPGGWFGHVDQQPGGPQGLSRLAGVPVICLPGNPISTLVSFLLFVAPTLGRAPAPVTALLDEERHGLAGHRDQFLRGRIRVDEQGRLRALGVGGAGSHLIAQAVDANALVRIPAATTLNRGDAVTVYPF